MTHDTDDKLANARSQAMTQYDSIVEMVDALQMARDADDSDALETAEQAIHCDALSVEVRSDWVQPGDKMTPAQFNILLCTGGPAVRIMGDLDEYGQPRCAWLECQDWFTPWVRVNDGINQDVLLAYASCFYFGEG